MADLLRHPASVEFSGSLRLRAAARRTTGRQLQLSYDLEGDLEAVNLPPPAAPARADELWRSTCFEAFVRREDDPGYIELNVSPSRRWAAYRFDAYREGMQPVDLTEPLIEVERGERRLGLHVTLELPLEPASTWRLALASVIEGADGGLAYHALRHGDGRPDFHRTDCFALELPAPEPS